MSKINGAGGISAEVVADSINAYGDRVTTFQLHYHRYIHSEFMTHRMFSRNASSSRAVPVSKNIELVRDSPATPIHWGKNKAGMQADEELDNKVFVEDYYKHLVDDLDYSPFQADFAATMDNDRAWGMFADKAACHAKAMDDAGYHKQIVNRLTEPFQFMNVVCSATDYDNFFWLRCHPDAQPEIQELAECMYQARQKSAPELLREGEYHTPYVEHKRETPDSEITYYSEGQEIAKDDALKISASCSAQVSYRKNDASLEKALMLFDRLVGMSPLHASPFEHIATPFSEDEYIERTKAYHSLKKVMLAQYKDESIAEMLASQVMYCGNFRGWTQYRKTLKHENIVVYSR